MGGTNFGGPTMTHAPIALCILPLLLNLTVALTGPSETSSCHSLLLANVVRRAFVGEPELPNPPSTSKRPLLSDRISPSGTMVFRNLPVSKVADLFIPLIERGPESILRLLRSVTLAFRNGGFGLSPSNWCHAALP